MTETILLWLTENGSVVTITTVLTTIIGIKTHSGARYEPYCK